MYPKPLRSPDSLSVGILRLWMVPNFSASALRIDSSTSKSRFATKTVSLGALLLSPNLFARSLASGAARGTEKSRLTARPSISAPFLAVRALAASSGVLNSTYPKLNENVSKEEESTIFSLEELTPWSDLSHGPKQLWQYGIQTRQTRT